MTTWTSPAKSNTGLPEVDFLFSDGLDFLFSDGTDFVFEEGTASIVWTEGTKHSASWTNGVKNTATWTFVTES